MDIEPMPMGDRKTLELIQNNEIEKRNSRKSNVNRSTIFEFLYFWFIFFLTVSFFFDLTVYFYFYQEKINILNNYNSVTFYLRIISDSLFIAPLLIYIRVALTKNMKNYILGIFIFFPQFILNIITIIKIFNQLENENESKENTIPNNNNTDINNEKELIYMFLSNFVNNGTNDNETDVPKISPDTQKTLLKLSPIINIIIYTITVVLTYLKIYKNF